MLDNSKDSQKLDAMKMIIGVCERFLVSACKGEYHCNIDGC